MSHGKANQVFQRQHLETSSYGVGTATQARSQLGDDRDVAEGVQQDTRVSKALLPRSKTHTNDNQLSRVHHIHREGSCGMDSHNCIRSREMPWSISYLYMASTEIHTAHRQPRNQKSSGQRSYSQIFSRRKKLEDSSMAMSRTYHRLPMIVNHKAH